MALVRNVASIRRYGVEIAMFVLIFLVDFSVDYLQFHLGAPVIVRAVTNVSVFLGAVITYFGIRIALSGRLGRKTFRGPISGLLTAKR